MKKIVFITQAGSDKTQDKEFVEIVAQKLNCEFIYNSAFDLNIIDQALPDLAGVFLDFEDVDQINLFKMRFEKKLSKNLIHIIVDPLKLDLLPNILRQSNLGHIVFRKFDQLENEAELYAKIVTTSPDEEREFDLSVLFSNIKIEKTTLIDPSGREKLIQRVLQRLFDFQVTPTITQSIATAVDELLMNALYDSKIEGHKGALQKIASLGPSDRSAIDVQFSVGATYFVASVTDLMGSIDRDKLFTRIAKSYNEKLSIDLSLAKTELGAGLGLSMVLRSGGSLLLTCQPGQRTTAILFFKITKRMLDFKKQFQFISTQFLS